jgi:hypothetical protein
MRLQTLLLALLILPTPLLAADQPEDPAAMRVNIMEETEVIARMDIDVPSTEFKDDGDVKTLEIVFLSKRSDGPSRVSPDGEVVFLYKASDEVQSDLIGKAFDLRVARALSGS